MWFYSVLKLHSSVKLWFHIFEFYDHFFSLLSSKMTFYVKYVRVDVNYIKYFMVKICHFLTILILLKLSSKAIFVWKIYHYNFLIEYVVFRVCSSSVIYIYIDILLTNFSFKYNILKTTFFNYLDFSLLYLCLLT